MFFLNSHQTLDCTAVEHYHKRQLEDAMHSIHPALRNTLLALTMRRLHTHHGGPWTLHRNSGKAEASSCRETWVLKYVKGSDLWLSYMVAQQGACKVFMTFCRERPGCCCSTTLNLFNVKQLFLFLSIFHSLIYSPTVTAISPHHSLTRVHNLNHM